MILKEEGEFVAASDATEDTDLYSDEAPIVSDEEEDEGDEIDYKSKYEAEAVAREKAEEVARNQKIRAEKAEGKRVEKPAPSENKNELSTKDLYALMEAKIPQADIDEVIEYAKLKNIPLTEAIQSNVVKAILADKAEHRASADATNTGAARRGSSKVSDETLLANANKGIVPEDDEGMKRLIALTTK